jgi:hypothetical protein
MVVAIAGGSWPGEGNGHCPRQESAPGTGIARDPEGTPSDARLEAHQGRASKVSQGAVVAPTRQLFAER